MLSEMQKRLKNMYISLGVTVAFVFAGGLLFQDDEVLLSAVAVAAFLICLVVFFVLDQREYPTRGSGREDRS
jgi:hypothetical protein